MAEVLNPVTGEIIDTNTASDDELLQSIREIEEVVGVLNNSLKGMKYIVQERMTGEGATLKITSLGKVRLRYSSRVGDKRLVDALYQECPDSLKKKCFAFDIRPLKTGLNELSKMGDTWRKKVDSLYEQVPSLVFEWTDVAVAEEATSNRADTH